MKLPAILTPAMVDHLNQTYFRKVWNSPDEHDGANFALPKAHKRLAVGSVPLDRSVVGLPTTDRVYATYRVPRHYFTNNIYMPYNQWITDDFITKTYALSITVFSEGGRQVPRGSVYLRHDPFKSEVLIAIEYAYTTKCTGESYPKLWATIYLDASRNTPVTSTLYQPKVGGTSLATVATAIQSALAHPAQTRIIFNGWTYAPSQAPTVIYGDVVEILNDPDITGYCDIIVDDNFTGYQSSLYSGYREILHIPKILNPHGYVITSDTLLMVIFDPVTKKGVLGHRIHPHALESITHHDFSVGRDWLNTFAASMGVPQVSVRLYLRFSSVPHRLGADKNRMSDLYSLPDAEIKKQLVGTSSQPIERWRAAYLEQSSWLTLAYQFKNFDRDHVVTGFIDAMGYYDVASVLSQLVHYHTYTGSALKIQKPARLAGYPCEVMVWSNGRKLPADAIEQIIDENRTFTIGFEDHPYLSIGDDLIIYILTGGERDPVSWSPTSGSPSITLTSDDYQLVQIKTYGTPQPTWQSNITKGYKLIPLSPGDYTVIHNVNGTVTFKANASHYGDKFYLIPLAPSFSITWNIDDHLDASESVIIPLTTTDSDGVVIPIVGRACLEFYLNGYRLAENIDYAITSVENSDGYRLQYLFTLSSQTYLDLENGNNLLEMVCHTDHLVSQDTGYTFNNSMYRDEPPCLWSKSCGRLFANGKLLFNVESEGNNLLSTDPVPDGAPFLAEWHLPYGVQKLLKGIDPAAENDVLFRISSALGIFPPTYPEVVVIDHLHALFSPALCQIVKDVSTGALVLRDEPNDQRFLQQIKPYQLILQNDPVINHNPLVDRRFVTLAAHYVNLGVTDPLQMHLVQRLVTILLDPASASIEEVLL